MGFGTPKRTPWAERDVENFHSALRMRVLRVLASDGYPMSPATICKKMHFGPVSPLAFIQEMGREGLIAEEVPHACLGYGGGFQITNAGRAMLNQQLKQEG